MDDGADTFGDEAGDDFGELCCVEELASHPDFAGKGDHITDKVCVGLGFGPYATYVQELATTAYQFVEMQVDLRGCVDDLHRFLNAVVGSEVGEGTAGRA